MKLFLFSPIFLIVYLVIIFFSFGITDSWSATYRKLKGWKVLFFTLALWLGAAAPLMILGLNASQNSQFQFLWFFAGAGIAFTGAAPVYWITRKDRKLSTENKIHIYSATGSVIFICAAIILTLPGWWNYMLVGLFLAFAGSQVISKTKLPNRTYWIETAIALVSFIALLINSLLL